ncbi:MAG: hypothetical protein HQL40_08085 [Alphaproteobacteria bacterium]|nr:hypothetical protein [Alphaproteobacteria bacterium]
MEPTTTRSFAGLTWTLQADCWSASDPRGRFEVIEYLPGAWTSLWFPAQAGCGCGSGAKGGGDFEDFDQAAQAIVALASAG